MKKYNITVNGVTYAVEVTEAGTVASAAPAAPAPTPVAAAPAAPAAAPAPAPAPAEEEQEEELADDGELVAVIAAAIAAYEGSTSTDGFVVRSIKRSKTNKWKRA